MVLAEGRGDRKERRKNMPRIERESGSGVSLFPRRKQGDYCAVEWAKGRSPVLLDFHHIEGLLGMPQAQAAQSLGISLTALKQVCRKLGVARWPYSRLSTKPRKPRRRVALPHYDPSAVPAAQPAAGAWWSHFNFNATDSASDDCIVSVDSCAETGYTRTHSVVSTCSSQDSVADNAESTHSTFSTDDLAWLLVPSEREALSSFANDCSTKAGAGW